MAQSLPPLERECFFIAPIGSQGSPERNRSDGILEFIVGRAAEELDLQAVRADQIAEPGQITLQVVDHVLGAKAAVADLTGLNANVFYELAIRHTARLPVALIAEKGCSLPFDIAQMRTIFFEHNDLRSADQCRRDIAAQLNEAITNGAVDSPIATSVDVQALQSGSAVERNVAELVTAVEGIARAQRTNADMMEVMYTLIGRRDMAPAALRDLLSAFRELKSYVEQSDDDQLSEFVDRLRLPIDYVTSRYGPTSKLAHHLSTERSEAAKRRRSADQALFGSARAESERLEEAAASGPPVDEP